MEVGGVNVEGWRGQTQGDVYHKGAARGLKGTTPGLWCSRVAPPPWHCVGHSLHSEATGLLDGSQQLVVELLVELICRDVDAVEARRERRRTTRRAFSLADVTTKL